MSATTSLPHRLNCARFPISFSNRVLQSINNSCEHMCQRQTFVLSSTPLSSRYKLRRRPAAHMRAGRHSEKDVSVQRNERRTSYEWSCSNLLILSGEYATRSVWSARVRVRRGEGEEDALESSSRPRAQHVQFPGAQLIANSVICRLTGAL